MNRLGKRNTTIVRLRCNFLEGRGLSLRCTYLGMPAPVDMQYSSALNPSKKFPGGKA